MDIKKISTSIHKWSIELWIYGKCESSSRFFFLLFIAMQLSLFCFQLFFLETSLITRNSSALSAFMFARIHSLAELKSFNCVWFEKFNDLNKDFCLNKNVFLFQLILENFKLYKVLNYQVNDVINVIHEKEAIAQWMSVSLANCRFRSILGRFVGIIDSYKVACQR